MAKFLQKENLNRQKVPMVAKDVKQLELTNQWWEYIGTTILENYLALSTKADDMHTETLEYYSMIYIPNRNACIGPLKYCQNICSGTICESSKTKLYKGPSTSKWINKLWCIETMEFYTAMRMKDPLLHANVMSQKQ